MGNYNLFILSYHEVLCIHKLLHLQFKTYILNQFKHLTQKTKICFKCFLKIMFKYFKSLLLLMFSG